MKIDQEDLEREKQIQNDIMREKEDQIQKKEQGNDNNLQTGKV